MMNVSTPGSTAVSGTSKLSSTRSALMGGLDDTARHDDHKPWDQNTTSSATDSQTADAESNMNTSSGRPMMIDPTMPARDSVPTFTADPVTDTAGGYGGVPPHFVPAGGNLTTPPDDENPTAPMRKQKSKLVPALAGLAMLLAVVGGGAALYMSQQSQDLRQKAAEDTNITCTGVELRKMETGQPENDPSKWTLVSGKTMTIKEGVKFAYKPTGCTAGWVAGIRMSYDDNDFLTPGVSEWCASNGDYCVRTAIFSPSGSKNIYVRSNLKKTISGIDYWCKHNNTWAQGTNGTGDPVQENAPGPVGYTCNMTGAHATITVQDDTSLVSKCYTDKDACTSYNEANCALTTGKYASVNECLSASRALACNTSSNLNYVSVIPFNKNTGQYDAKGYYTSKNGKNYYVAGFRAFRTLPAVTGFTYSSLTFQCLSGPNKPFGECDQNRLQGAPIAKAFGSGDYVDFEIEREITAQCGGFQSDAYLVDITVDGAKVSCSNNSVGSAYGVCNVSSAQDNQRCPGLPEGWSNICSTTTPSPSPTPTGTISCPVSAYINLASADLTKNAQGKLVISWTAPSPAPQPVEQYIITRVKRPIVASGPTPTWAPNESVVGPAPASSSKFVKTGSTLSYTDTTNTATCGFVYHYMLRAYNTTAWDVDKDTQCNVLVPAEISLPCDEVTPTPTVTPTGVLTPTPTVAIGCNSTCVDDAQCKTVNANYVCSIEHGNRCRLEGNRGNTACQGPGATNTPTPVIAIGCNDSCVTNSDCSNPDHICYQTGSGSKVCRLDANVESTTCTRAVAQNQPELPQALPQTGPEDWALWLKAGLVTLGLGAALMLLL